LWHIGKFTADDIAVAQQYFRRAIDLDPAFSSGYCGLGAVHYYASYIFPTRGPIEELSAIAALMRRAVALDDGDAEARSWLSAILLIWGDARGALAENQRALELSPNFAFGHAVYGHFLTWSGRPREGLAALRKSVRLDPRNPWFGVVRSQFAAAHY